MASPARKPRGAVVRKRPAIALEAVRAAGPRSRWTAAEARAWDRFVAPLEGGALTNWALVLDRVARVIACSWCGALPGQGCRHRSGDSQADVHARRFDDARRVVLGLEVRP